MTEATPSSYWIASNALYITLNANDDPDYIVGNAAAGAQILCYMKGIDGLEYDAGHNYRRWPLSLSPTYFSSQSEKLVYVAVPRPSNPILQAVVVFPSERLDIYGKNAEGSQVGSTDYYYIFLQGIITETNAGRTLDRDWQQRIDTGTLSSDEAIMAGGDDTWWQYSSVDDTVTFLKEIVMGTKSWFHNIRLGDSHHNLTGVATAETSGEYADSDTMVVTPSYLTDNYLSRKKDDTASGLITFKKGLVSICDLILYDAIRSHQFETGLYNGRGWRIDNLGNAELESLRVRSFLEVVELLINRLQAQEGDTLFTDNDQVDKVEKVVDETDGSVSYVLSLKEKYDGYITGQMYGNIIKGIINTLAAKQAGVSDETERSVEVDGSNKYYTSWMRVIATHNTSSRLGVNQIQVVLYGDEEVPAKRNFEPCELMTIARWGCVDYSDPSDPDYEAVKESIIRRQRVFLISTIDGRVVKYNGVDSPILKNGNYGVTIGELPEFVKRYPDVKEILDQVGEHTDWLYAQGAVVGSFVKVDKEGLPVPVTVFCGEWEDGSAMQEPEVGRGIYYYNKYNEDSQQYEIHEVRRNGGRWQCLQSQPVISGGVATYYEPKWNSPYWALVDGNDNLTIEFVSSKGYSFRRGSVNTDITPHLFYGNVDITDDVAEEYWDWTRESESGKTVQDETWNAQHRHMKQIHLSNTDMPPTWSTKDKAIFTCTVTLNDGKTTRIVDNQIIS